MSDEVDLVTWLRDVADMKARVYVVMEFEATRFRACADELAEARTKATEQGKYAVEMFDALKATQLELAELRKANEALLRNGSRCALCGCSVPKGAAYCSECWLPP